MVLAGVEIIYLKDDQASTFILFTPASHRPATHLQTPWEMRSWDKKDGKYTLTAPLPRPHIWQNGITNTGFTDASLV